MASSSPKTSIDPVQALQENFKKIEKLEREQGKLMIKLSNKGLSLTRKAFKRLFKDVDLTVIDFKGAECAIPHTKTNLRIDFPVVQDTRFQVENILEESTGISVNGFKVDGPVAGTHLQVRIPLAALSTNGLKKV